MNSSQRVAGVTCGLFLAVLGAIPCRAQSEYRKPIIATGRCRFCAVRSVGRYVGTHKFPLVVDTVVVLANAADAASTLHAAHNCPTCIDYGLGRNPSPARTWGELMAFSAGMVAFNQMAYHHYREGGTDPSWGGQKFFVLAFSVPMILHATVDVRDNVNVQPTPAELARRRLMRR